MRKAWNLIGFVCVGKLRLEDLKQPQIQDSAPDKPQSQGPKPTLQHEKQGQNPKILRSLEVPQSFRA